MQFYGNGVVWNSAKKKRLCKFEGGIFETDNSVVIDRLIELGYEHDEIVKEKPVEEEPTEKELLILKAEGLGIEANKRWGIKKLIEAIAEKDK